MPKTSYPGTSGAVRMAPSPGLSRRHYHRDTLGAVLSILSANSAEAAVLFAPILAGRPFVCGSIYKVGWAARCLPGSLSLCSLLCRMGLLAGTEAWLAEHVCTPHLTPRADGPAVRDETWETRHG